MRPYFILFAVLASALSSFGHASHKMHEADICAVFNGCVDAEFMHVVKCISSGMDNELPRRFREQIGPVPGNHRLLGHCWTFGDAIPKRVLDVVEARYPGRKDDFIALWRDFANETITNVSRATGLPRKQSGALAALVHDVHLLGDRTPDNKLVDHVLTTKEIQRNIVKSAGVLWGKRSDVTANLAAATKAAYSRGDDEFSRAEELLAAMKDAGVGDSLLTLIAASNHAEVAVAEVAASPENGGARALFLPRNFHTSTLLFNP